MKPATDTRKQTWQICLLLFFAGLTINCAAAVLLRVPGYMDAEYYFINGQRIASGEGFTEMVLWNYLDDPQGLPHPSHTYWLPLTSLTAALGLWVFQKQQFLFAQAPFILAAALVPVITYCTARYFYPNHRDAFLAGVLGLLPGFYLAIQNTTSTLGLFLLGGGLFFWILAVIERSAPGSAAQDWRLLLLGGIAGFMYLTRSDGVMWAATALIFALFSGMKGFLLRGRQFSKISGAFFSFALVMAGFLSVSGFWFAHNLMLFGSLLPPGGSRTLWLADYNQMFAYPADGLGFAAWLNSGLGTILNIRIQALWENLKTLLAVEGEILLLPLVVIGIFQNRRKTSVRTMLLLWLATFLLMSLVFPFAGKRGGFLHSSAAFQPFLWCMAPAGFSRFIQWGSERRGWKPTAWRNFAIILCVLLAGYTVVAYGMKVIGADAGAPVWQQSNQTYAELEQAVRATFPDLDMPVVVNNPPGYYLASGGRPAVVLPDGDEEALVAVADRFGAEIVAVDRNTVPSLLHLYENPASNGRLEYLYSVSDIRIYRVKR